MYKDKRGFCMNNFDKKSVYQYFEELFFAKQTGNEQESLQNYLMQFAKQNGLNYSFDKASNVVVSTDGDREKTTIIVSLDFRVMKPKKKWFDLSFWSGKLLRSGDYVLSNRVPLCAGGLGGMAIALHVLTNCKDVQVVFIFDRNNINIDFFAQKKINSTKVVQLVASEKDEIYLSSPSAYNCLIKFSNDKSFLTNSLDLKTFKLVVLENEKTNNNLALKLLIKLLDMIKDAKINKFYSGFFLKEEYKNEIVFTTRMPLLELKKIIKDFYKENKKLYPTLALRCTRQINQTLVLSQNQMSKFILNFENDKSILDSKEETVSHIVDVNSNSGFVYFDILTYDEKAFKQKFGEIENNVKLDNAQCVYFDELKSFSNVKSNLANEMKNANFTLSREVALYKKASLMGEIASENKKIDGLMLSYQVENLGLADEKLCFSSLINTSLYLENYLKSLEDIEK